MTGSGGVAAVHWYAGDALGSIHQVLDSTGATVNMNLTTAWGEPIPRSAFSFANQVGDRHGFTQRERDDESSLMHYRARSYDPRTGRFSQKDPLLDERLSAAYAYGLNSPSQAIDPTGEKTEVLSIGNSLVVLTFATVSTDIGWSVWGGNNGDINETENARTMARWINKAVHELWNENGAGWRLTVRIHGNLERRNLYILPWVFAVSEEIQFNAVFKDYDKIWVYNGLTETDAQATGTKFHGTAIPKKGGAMNFNVTKVPYPYYVTHTARYKFAGTERDFAHEYGHLLGLADRYEHFGFGASDDTGWAGALMAKTGPKAIAEDIIELGLTTLGMDVVRATPNRTRLFGGRMEPGMITAAGFRSPSFAGLRSSIDVSSVTTSVRSWPEWKRAPK